MRLLEGFLTSTYPHNYPQEAYCTPFLGVCLSFSVEVRKVLLYIKGVFE